MLKIDTRELSGEEELALASSISDALDGNAVALVRDFDIVIDAFDGIAPTADSVLGLVREFVSKRKDALQYSVEKIGDIIVVHSPDPLVGTGRRRTQKLPPNLLICPYCSFVTPYQEMYDIHTRSHGFIMSFG